MSEDDNSDLALRVEALETILLEKKLVDSKTVDQIIEHYESGELLLDVPDPDSEDHAPPAQNVERSELFGKYQRATQRQHNHAGSQSHPGRHRRDVRQAHNRIEQWERRVDARWRALRVRNDVVLRDPDRVQPGFIGGDRDALHHLGVGASTDVRAAESDFHCSSRACTNSRASRNGRSRSAM